MALASTVADGLSGMQAAPTVNSSSSSLFESWPRDPAAPMWRIVDPPLPVTVELGTAIVTRSAHFGVNKVRLGIRKGGLRLTDTIRGLLRAWARVADGTWLGLVAFTVPTGNGQGLSPSNSGAPSTRCPHRTRRLLRDADRTRTPGVGRQLTSRDFELAATQQVC